MATTPHTQSVNSLTLTVLDLADLYLDEIFRRAEASQVSWNHFRSSHLRLRRICGYFGRTTLLSSIGKRELMEAVLHFASRPACLDRPYQKRPKGQPVSIATAKHTISQIKALFAWAGDHDELRWDRPRGFDRLFRIKHDRLLTPQEKYQQARELVSGEVRVFSMDQLARLYRSATSR